MGSHCGLRGLLVLCAVIAAVTANCYRGPLRRSGHWKYCKTRGLVSETIDFGKSRKTDNCYDCSCDSSGLHCCGFGIKSSAFSQHNPSMTGCQVVIEGCSYHYVQDFDSMEPCRALQG